MGPLNDHRTESELVLALRDGCCISFKRLYIKYSAKIYFVAKKFKLSHEEAENVVQDVFLKIWEKKDTLLPELSFNAYVLTIAKHMVIKMIRKAVHEQAEQLYFGKIPPCNSIGTEEVVRFTELSSRYKEVINRLSERRRQVFLLNREHGLTVAEIARLTDLSVRTVENHIFQATQIVRDELRHKVNTCQSGLESST